MAYAVRKCRVCGKEYEACRTMMNRAVDVFRWQEVACSSECGAEYLRRIAESRDIAKIAPKAVMATQDVKTEPIAHTEDSAELLEEE